MIYDYRSWLRRFIVHHYSQRQFPGLPIRDKLKNLLTMWKIPSDHISESLYKLKIPEFVWLKSVLELYDLDTHRKRSKLDQKLKTIVKRRTDQKLRLQNFDVKNEKIETGAVVTSRSGFSWHWERKRNFAISRKQKDSVRKETHAVSDTRVMNVQNRPPEAAPPFEPPTPRGRSASRKRSIRGRSPSGKSNRQPCEKILEKYLQQIFLTIGIFPNVRFPLWKVEEQPIKWPKKGGDKSAVALRKMCDKCVAYHRTLCFQKLYRILGRTQHFWDELDEYDSQELLRQANILEAKGPSLNVM